jgi:very-short-patch-repair endonuclease
MEGMEDAREVDPNNAGEHRTRDPAVELAAWAKRQHGVIARRQIAELGLGRHYIDRQVQRGRLHVLHRGVYAVGHRRLTGAGVWMAAVLACGDGAVLSHRSAGALWRIRESSGARIEITASRERRRSGLTVHRVPLPVDEVTVEDAIPVTTPARTLLDLAAVLDEHKLARAAERAEALRLTSPTSLADLVERYPRRPGTPNLKRLVEDGRIVGTDTANDFERRFLSLVDAENLPRPLVNRPHGAIRPDIRWTEHRLIIELDGFETHGTRQAFERDRARDRALLTAGWRVARITKRQLDDAPAEIAAQLRTMLRSATTAAPAPPRDPRTPAPRSRPAAR